MKELLPLLRKATGHNKDKPLGVLRAAVVNITSILGSITENNTGGYYPYRCSKVRYDYVFPLFILLLLLLFAFICLFLFYCAQAALNSATKSLSIDLKPYNIIATCIHPGWVKTEMGGPNAPVEVVDACKSIIQTIGNLNESHSGAFLNSDGTVLPW